MPLYGSRNPPPLQSQTVSRTPWLFLVLSSTAILISYADRANLATCILPMAQDLEWSLSSQGVVLSAFFAGYALTGLLGGYLADRFGGSRVLQAGIILWSVCTFLTPAFAKAGLGAMVLDRVLLGMGEGVAFPAIHAMIPQRVPGPSRSLAVSLITGASYLGAVIAFALSPFLIEEAGWPSVFYFFGALPVLWFPVWWAWGEERSEALEGKEAESEEKAKCGEGHPLSNPSSSNSQRIDLTPSSAPSTAAFPTSSAPPEGLTWAQARFLLARKEVWAILVAQYTQAWGIYGLLSWLPSYYSKTFDIDVTQLAAFTLAPYLLQTLVGIASGYLADSLIAAGWSIKRVRQLLQTAGTVLPALFLLLATTTHNTSSDSASSLLFSFLYVTIGAGLSAFTLGGVSCSHLDICPRNAGLVFAAGNTLATVGGLVSVPIAGLVLEKCGSFDAVFALFAAHYVVGAALYAAWIGDKDILQEL
ncbi:hypothetical protein NSK_005832 [Nannochloropsis salina CCMP1776]|uniref:Major facilitator superfamily (MFS) profile domain-containing protein n=1 Tax=Nannochloropsis salina CCMP1776 TaxID=1027361 RepID=A0A4D9D2Q0_9STRA|nr:hypothetical protein NSK_005832 [Nannochloropsis salina CCMP1776]|eukprot:TFJ82879.1 hypothetical protein NSK_005832 [Nannochloropsis salina CCMP1776]